MNIWLKELSLEDGKEFCDLLMTLARYPDVYARPVPVDFAEEEFLGFKEARVRMREGINLPNHVEQTSTFWVMDGETPIGYATLKHKVDPTKIGGHFGLCLKKEYQNKGIGFQVSELLSEIAYRDLGIKEVIYTSKDENTQSQKSIEKIGAKLTDIHDGYHFYTMDLEQKYKDKGNNK